VVDIFDEVSDDLRAERAATLLRRYGSLLVVAAILVLIAVGGQQAWTWYQGQQNDKAASAYIALNNQIIAQGTGITNDQRVADAKALGSFAATAGVGYRDLAKLRAAGLYADAGQIDAAEAQWNDVADDAASDPMIRNLADLLWAQHALGTAPDNVVLARLQPLTVPENPYHALAQETEALLYLNEDKPDQAKALFSQISADPNAPQGVRNRADGLLAKLNG
jgi:hypothetical protein